MEDKAIIRLYEARDERAISETDIKYGRYCRTISYRIVEDSGTAEECTNDTYMVCWKKIPPTRPKMLSAFLAKICRNLSLKRFRDGRAAKRGGGQVDLSLDELVECVSGKDEIWSHIETKEVARVVNEFLSEIPEDHRAMFSRRYFAFESISDIATSCGYSESKVKMSLKRTRDKLAARLEEEEIRW